MCLKPKMKDRPRGRLGLPLPYTTVLLLLGWHDVSLEEQQHAMVQLAELQIVPPVAVSL